MPSDTVLRLRYKSANIHLSTASFFHEKNKVNNVTNNELLQRNFSHYDYNYLCQKADGSREIHDRSHKPINQWQVCFPLKAVLPLVKTFETASDRGYNTDPGIISQMNAGRLEYHGFSYWWYQIWLNNSVVLNNRPKACMIVEFQNHEMSNHGRLYLLFQVIINIRYIILFANISELVSYVVKTFLGDGLSLVITNQIVIRHRGLTRSNGGTVIQETVLTTTLDASILHFRWPLYMTDKVCSDKITLSDLAGRIRWDLIIAGRDISVTFHTRHVHQIFER